MHMEKRIPHYPLRAIHAQMRNVEDMHLTTSAKHGIYSLGMIEGEALLVIQRLNAAHFHKSMTTYADHRSWQDVYYTSYCGKALYVKFQQKDEYFVISFKEHKDV